MPRVAVQYSTNLRTYCAHFGAHPATTGCGSAGVFGSNFQRASALVVEWHCSIFLFVCTDIFLAGVGKKKLALRKLRIPAAFVKRHFIGGLDSPYDSRPLYFILYFIPLFHLISSSTGTAS
jgi:hypothetical protein